MFYDLRYFLPNYLQIISHDLKRFGLFSCFCLFIPFLYSSYYYFAFIAIGPYCFIPGSPIITLCKDEKISFHNRTVHLDIIIFPVSTDTKEVCFRRSIKIYIKAAPTCFGVITIIREGTI